MACNPIPAPELDVNISIVDDRGKPTKYFEDTYYQLTKSIESLIECIEDLDARVTVLEGP